MAKSRHHIKPKSRGGGNSKSNISYVSVKEHQKYHALFGNRTPVEIIDYLTNYFWRGNVEYLRQYINIS